MKICPTCRRTYDDDGLNFCLEDGSVLNFSSFDAAAPTIVMHPARPTNAPRPAGQVQASWDPQQQAGAYSMQPRKKSRAWLWAVAILGFAVLLCGGGFAGFFVYVASFSNSNLAAANSSKGSANTNSTRSNTFSSPSPGPSPGEPSDDVTKVDLSTLTRPYSIYGTTEFADGELLMAAKQKGYYYVLVTPDSYRTDRARTRVSVRNPDVADTELGYGLIFHSDTDPLEKDYAFLIDSKRRRFRVVRHEPNDEITVRPWTSSKLINEGAVENVLEAFDKGKIIELYINGQLATTIDNKQGPAGGVPGFYSGDGVKIGFKKLEIIK